MNAVVQRIGVPPGVQDEPAHQATARGSPPTSSRWPNPHIASRTARPVAGQPATVRSAWDEPGGAGSVLTPVVAPDPAAR